MTSEQIAQSLYNQIVKKVNDSIEDDRISIEWQVIVDYFLIGDYVAYCHVFYDSDFKEPIIINDLTIGLTDETPMKYNRKEVKEMLKRKLIERYK